MSRPILSLPPSETADVREAKDLARHVASDDAETVAFALRLVEARNDWFNTRRRASAADLKFLHRPPQALVRNFKSKAALESETC